MLKPSDQNSNIPTKDQEKLLPGKVQVEWPCSKSCCEILPCTTSLSHLVNDKPSMKDSIDMPPRFPHSQDMGHLGSRFPTSLFWGDAGRCKGTRLWTLGDTERHDSPGWGMSFFKKSVCGHPLLKRGASGCRP
jgi:hypothetical protein